MFNSRSRGKSRDPDPGFSFRDMKRGKPLPWWLTVHKHHRCTHCSRRFYTTTTGRSIPQPLKA